MKTPTRNFLILGVLTALGLAAWQHKQIQELPQDQTVYHVPYEEHVVDLPEDGNRWFTTTVYRDDSKADALDKRLAAMVAHPTIARFIAQTTYNEWDAEHRMYQERRVKMGSTLPCFIVQDHNGRVVYKASGENLPSSSQELIKELDRAIENCRPFRPKPDPKPDPKPTPKPDPVIPDLRQPDEQPQPKPDDFSLWALLVPLLGLGAGAATEWKKSNQ